MRIGIDAAPLIGNRGGVGWHTYYLLRALLNLRKDLEFVGYVRAGSLGGLDIAEWPHDLPIRWVEAVRGMLATMGARDGLDLYHGTNFKMPTTGRLAESSQFTTCGWTCSLAILVSCSVSAGRSTGPKGTVLKARKVITVSESSANDIARLAPYPARKNQCRE